MYPTLITPSPSTFSIWGVIYSLLIISIIMMMLKKKESYYQNAVNETFYLFALSCLFNISWIISFSYVQIELSLLFISGLLITLTLISLKLLEVQEGKQWLLPLTFGLYNGWLFIATLVNIATMLVKWEWKGFGIGDDLWASFILIVAIILVTLMSLLKTQNAAFVLPIAWAYWGIYQVSASALVENTALIGAIVLVALMTVQFYRNHFSLVPNKQV